MDVHSPAQRRYNMSRIRGKNTKPELLLRKWLSENSYRYKLHRKGLPGKPDIAFPGLRKVIFVHGCFWHRHRCKYFVWPKTNANFWKKKINDNAKRDIKNYCALIRIGWKYLVLWECKIRFSEFALWKKVNKFLIAN